VPGSYVHWLVLLALHLNEAENVSNLMLKQQQPPNVPRLLPMLRRRRRRGRMAVGRNGRLKSKLQRRERVRPRGKRGKNRSVLLALCGHLLLTVINF